MTFRDPVVAGDGQLVREHLHSPDYEQGVSGWSIRRDGSAEFNDAMVRGTLAAESLVSPGSAAGTDDARLEIPTPLPAPLDGYTHTLGLPYAAAMVLYPGATDDSYAYLATTDTADGGTLVHLGHVEDGAVLEHVPGTPLVQSWIADGGIVSHGHRCDDFTVRARTGIELECSTILLTPTGGGVVEVDGQALGGRVVGYDYATSNSGLAGAGELIVFRTDVGAGSGPVTFRTGRAYRVEVETGLFGSAVGNLARLRLRKGTVVAGALICDWFRRRTEGALVVDGATSRTVANRSGVDITTDVIVTLALDGGAGSVQAYGSATEPRSMLITELGYAADYPGAWAIP